MSKNKSVDLKSSDRGELARQVKQLRLGLDMRQEDLARDAGISRQTLSDIENGNVASPQLRTLRRIYQVLGVDIEPTTFEAQTEVWLGILGTLIESVPAARRPRAVDGAIRALANEITPSNVTEVQFGDVRGSLQDLMVANESIDESRPDTEPDYNA